MTTGGQSADQPTHGHASVNGPAPDLAELSARAVPGECLVAGSTLYILKEGLSRKHRTNRVTALFHGAVEEATALAELSAALVNAYRDGALVPAVPLREEEATQWDRLKAIKLGIADTAPVQGNDRLIGWRIPFANAQNGQGVEIIRQIEALLEATPSPARPVAGTGLREVLFRLKTECEASGLADKAGFDCWISAANAALQDATAPAEDGWRIASRDVEAADYLIKLLETVAFGKTPVRDLPEAQAAWAGARERLLALPSFRGSQSEAVAADAIIVLTSAGQGPDGVHTELRARVVGQSKLNPIDILSERELYVYRARTTPSERPAFREQVPAPPASGERP